MGKKLKIAVTGGMGSGKSTVCNFFRDAGNKIIIADDIAKEILLNDKDVKKKIIEAFGNDAYDKNEVNRKYLAEKVFPDPKNVKKINEIVHPPTIKKINELAEENLKSSNIVFVESALVYEAKMWKAYDYVILVTSEDEKKISRIVNRDNTDKKSIAKRLENQIPDKNKRSRADFVIENNSSLEDLKKRSHFILTILKNLA